MDVFLTGAIDYVGGAIADALLRGACCAWPGPLRPSGRRNAGAVFDAPGRRTESWSLEAVGEVLGPLADALALDLQFSGDKAKHVRGWTQRASSVLMI